MPRQKNKVAAITLSFWITKVIATTLGDLSGDLLAITLGLGYVLSLLFACGTVLALLGAQIKAARFYPLLYWLLIFGTTVVGTEVSDVMDRSLHLGYVAGALTLATALLAILMLWRLREGRIRVHPICGRQEELFYWVAIIFASSLGSVVSDLLGDRLGLGMLGSALIFAGIAGCVLLLHYVTRINKAVLFWTAFVFTRL